VSLPEPVSIGAREAAVTAALAGAVVVVLGYASGLGLRAPLVAGVVTKPPAPVASSPVAPAATVVPGVVLVPAVITPVPRAVTTPPVHQYPVPPAPPLSSTPDPTPGEPPACTPGLLDGVLAPVTALLGGLLDGGLLGAGELGASDGAASSGGLVCEVTGLIGSSCCGSTTTSAKASSR